MDLSVGIGVLGCGTVGASVVERLFRDHDTIARRSGATFTIRGIAICDTDKARPSGIEPRLFAKNAIALVDDPSVDVVIECIGGTIEAAELVERALDRGCHVITANKDLLATQGPRLQALARLRGVGLRYEAAVCGAIPIVRTIADALAGDEVTSIAGVLNGTCTFLLSAMEDGASYEAALDEARERGYAEADPSSDVDGIDTAHKLALLVQLAFELAVISLRIRRGGIRDITQRDIGRARMLGYRIRLVAAAIRSSTGVHAEVAPVLVRDDHPFAQLSGVENIVHVVARGAGDLYLRGAGAGGAATASAVLADTIATIRSIGAPDDQRHRARTRALEPAIDVTPFFERLRHHPELPRYPVWDESLQPTANAPASQNSFAFAWPGKEHLP